MDYKYHLVDENGYITGMSGGNSPKADNQDDLQLDDGTDRSNDMWDNINKVWKADDRTIPETIKEVTKLDFIELFTDDEMEKILETAKTSAKVELFVKKIDAAQDINLNDKRLQSGIRTLEQFELLSAGRADEILNNTSDKIQIIQPPRQ